MSDQKDIATAFADGYDAGFRHGVNQFYRPADAWDEFEAKQQAEKAKAADDAERE